MQPEKIIIIGAGAAGLMCARILSKAGKEVLVLEARDRTGGRIHTFTNDFFTMPVESGAEFIHGSLPVTINLLKEADIRFEPMKGSTWQVRDGALQPETSFFADWELLEKSLRELKEDLTIADFMATFFSDEKHAALRASIKGFAEGYDAADTLKASTFALRDEWLSEEEGTNFRVKSGYGKMIDFLERECVNGGAVIELNTIVTKVKWERNAVTINCSNEKQFTGNKIIITVPLGILQQTAASENAIAFIPAIPEKAAAIEKMGFGSVIKVLIEFKSPFWKSAGIKKQFSEASDLSFLISDASIPTWWTQYPEENALLTGWLAGPSAEKWKNKNDQLILEDALTSLASIFKWDVTDLKENISAWHVANWTNDPFTHGAYAYATLDSVQSVTILEQPVEDTLFFAGEAIYSGPAMGTVEAALASAVKVTGIVIGE
ncbi:MAG: FAD-dependent oxidoreductase [Chitinophagaceae bacterium]|nr:FAD-dependent oxidoreductase [Chitinophagaceae bacterium]